MLAWDEGGFCDYIVSWGSFFSIFLNPVLVESDSRIIDQPWLTASFIRELHFFSCENSLRWPGHNGVDIADTLLAIDCLFVYLFLWDLRGKAWPSRRLLCPHRPVRVRRKEVVVQLVDEHDDLSVVWRLFNFLIFNRFEDASYRLQSGLGALYTRQELFDTR